MNTTTTTTAERIAAARASAGKTQTTLAADAGISQSYLCQLEQGTRTPRLATLNALAKALHVKVTKLLPDHN